MSVSRLATVQVQYVLVRLEVTMHDAIVVQIFQCKNSLRKIHPTQPDMLPYNALRAMHQTCYHTMLSVQCTIILPFILFFRLTHLQSAYVHTAFVTLVNFSTLIASQSTKFSINFHMPDGHYCLTPNQPTVSKQQRNFSQLKQINKWHNKLIKWYRGKQFWNYDAIK